jgi:hypothetical protein
MTQLTFLAAVLCASTSLAASPEMTLPLTALDREALAFSVEAQAAAPGTSGTKSVELAYSPKTRTLAYLGDRLVLFNAGDLSYNFHRPLDFEDLGAAAVSADGGWAAYAKGADGRSSGKSSIFTVDLSSAFLTEVKLGDASEGVSALALDPSGTALVVALEKKAWLWDLKTRKKIAALDLDLRRERVWRVLFSPDGKLVAVATSNGVRLFDAATGKFVRSLVEGTNATSAAFSPDGRYLATGWGVVETATGKKVFDFPFHVRASGEAFSPSGALVATHDVDTIVVYDLNGRVVYAVPPEEKTLPLSRLELLRAELGESSISGFAFGHDDRTLFVFGNRGDNVSLFRPVVIRHVLTEKAASVKASEAPADYEPAKRFVREELAVKLKELAEANRPLLAPRGEFETTAEHRARLDKAKAAEDALRKEYEDRAEGLVITNEAMRRIGVGMPDTSASYFVTAQAALGPYDADAGEFEVAAFGQTFFVSVPRDQAPQFKEKAAGLFLQGRVKYKDAETARFLDAALRLNDRFATFMPLSRQAPLNVAPVARAPADLAIARLALSEPSNDGVLDSGENGTVTVEARNSGSGPAYGVTVEAALEGPAVAGLRLEDRSIIGTLMPGETKSASLGLSGGEELASGPLRLRAILREANGFDSRPMVLAFQTRAFLAPKLVASRLEFQDADGRRVLSKGKESQVTLTVRNAGQGAARGVSALLASGHPEIKIFGENLAALGALAPGESKRAVFNVTVTRRYDGPANLPLSFALTEERSKFNARPELAVALDAEPGDISVVSVRARAAAAAAEPSESVEEPPVVAEAARALGPDDLAVVIGIERYGNVSAKSDYSYADAKLMRAYLKALGIPERNIEFLGDDKATLSALSKTLERWLTNKVKKESRVFVYYSGHGAPDPVSGDSYLLPFDGDPNYLAETAYPLRKLYDKLGKLPAREVLVMLDSCFSGAGGRSVLARGARPLVTAKDTGALAPQVAVLAATQGTQISTSSPEKGHGVFTYFLLKAIKDGKKDAAQAFADLKLKVEDEAKSMNVSQSPSFTADARRLEGGFLFRK